MGLSRLALALLLAIAGLLVACEGGLNGQGLGTHLVSRQGDGGVMLLCFDDDDDDDDIDEDVDEDVDEDLYTDEDDDVDEDIDEDSDEDVDEDSDEDVDTDETCFPITDDDAGTAP